MGKELIFRIINLRQMKFAAIIAAVLATANAVKENLNQIGAGTTTESEGYMQETKTDVTYAAVDLD